MISNLLCKIANYIFIRSARLFLLPPRLLGVKDTNGSPNGPSLAPS